MWSILFILGIFKISASQCLDFQTSAINRLSQTVQNLKNIQERHTAFLKNESQKMANHFLEKKELIKKIREESGNSVEILEKKLTEILNKN